MDFCDQMHMGFERVADDAVYRTVELNAAMKPNTIAAEPGKTTRQRVDRVLQPTFYLGLVGESFSSGPQPPSSSSFAPRGSTMKLAE
jgi:hypothetical protein